MNNDNNHAMLGLNSDGDNLFDFGPVFSKALWGPTHDNQGRQMQTAQAEEVMHVMPLTKSEIKAILAARASTAPDCHHTSSLAPPELNTSFSAFEDPSAYGASFNYDGVETLISTNFNDFVMADYGNALPNALDGLPQFEPADVFGALTDFRPHPADQSGREAKLHDPMKQTVNNNASNTVAFSPIQAGESVRQPEHVKSVLQAWSVGSKCTWPECTSRALFKTKASFNMHVTNVHTSPLLCLVANCLQKTPFGRLSDLRRHEQSAHSAERKFVCNVVSCGARIKEFARKDHLAKHMRERHNNYFCPINHCPRSTKSSFHKPEDVAEHITAEHGPYECALRACAQAPLSKFSDDSLLNHLRNHHGMPPYTTWDVTFRMENRLSRTVIETDLGRANCGECKTCEKRRYVT